MKFVIFAILTICGISHTLAGNFKQEYYQNVHMLSQQNSKCLEPLNKIQNSGELRALADCELITGSIHVTNYEADILDLGKIKTIKGDFIVTNVSSLKVIQASELESIGGEFDLDTLTSLTSLSLSKLQAVETLKWHVLPILTQVTFSKGINQIKSITMSDTSLTGITGFNVDTLKSMTINNNRFLEWVESSVTEITGELSISANADNLRVSMPNLVSVKGITVKDTEEVDFHELQTIEYNGDFINNNFRELKLPKLKSAGHTLSIIKNKMLSNIDMNSLTEVGGGLIIVDNSKVEKIDFFSSLKSVGGAIEFRGDITDNKFNSLKIVRGSAILNSSSSQFDCKKWMTNEVSKVVRGGKIECSSGEKGTEIMLIDKNGEITETRQSNNGKNKSGYLAKSSANIPYIPPLLGMILGIFISTFVQI